MRNNEEELVREALGKVLEPELIDLVVEKGEILYAKEGKQIITPGSHLQFFQLILQGTVKVSRPAEDGSDLLMYYLTGGEACAMSITCCMTTRKSEVTAVAEEDAIMLLIPLQYTDRWMVEYPTWKRFIFSTYQNRFNDLLLTIDSIAFLKVDERLMEYLERKSRTLGTNIISATHEQIAGELNTRREVVSRLLKKLEELGKVRLGRNRIELL